MCKRAIWAIKSNTVLLSYCMSIAKCNFRIFNRRRETINGVVVANQSWVMCAQVGRISMLRGMYLAFEPGKSKDNMSRQ